jgi:hypothetical protein
MATLNCSKRHLLKLALVSAVLVWACGCAQTETGKLFRDATQSPINLLLTPIALPGAILLDAIEVPTNAIAHEFGSKGIDSNDVLNGMAIATAGLGAASAAANSGSSSSDLGVAVAGVGGAAAEAAAISTGSSPSAIASDVGAPMSLSNSSAGSSAANSATCAKLLALARQCKTNQQNMGEIGTVGNGTTGQAGAQNDCYNSYMAGYRAEGCE